MVQFMKQFLLLPQLHVNCAAAIRQVMSPSPCGILIHEMKELERSVVLNPGCISGSIRSFEKMTVPKPHHRDSDFIGWSGTGPRHQCFSNS